MLMKEEMVWFRLNDKLAVRFTCLCNLRSNKYLVQSGDYFRLPLSKDSIQYFHAQFVDFFIDITVDRSDWFDTLEAAIDDHIAQFGFGW